MRNEPKPPSRDDAQFHTPTPDAIAWLGIGAYSAIHIAWFIGINGVYGWDWYSTAGLVAFILPLFRIATLAFVQIAFQSFRFSVPTNLAAIAIMSMWFWAMIDLVERAAASC